ncbi:MAG: hypothetical protein HY744_23095 [Deltaproteobacteria bacterium]|nr:hypothetical protein [Deltaproteobacteria bacterium]
MSLSRKQWLLLGALAIGAAVVLAASRGGGPGKRPSSLAPAPRATATAVAPGPGGQWSERVAAIRAARARREAQAPAAPAGVEQDRAFGAYVRSEVLPKLRALVPRLRQCHRRLSDAGAPSAGNLVLRFTIAAEPGLGGVVEEASMDEEQSGELAADAALAACARETASELVFGDPPSGGQTLVRYPASLEPPPPPPDGGARRHDAGR